MMSLSREILKDQWGWDPYALWTSPPTVIYGYVGCWGDASRVLMRVSKDVDTDGA